MIYTAMEQVRPGVWLVKGENGGRFPYAHSLFLAGESKLLIDTGAGRGLERLAGKADLVILSHYHRDHVSGNDRFAQASFRIHPLDAPGVESAAGFLRLSGMDRLSGEACRELVGQVNFKPTVLDGRITDGERIDLGGLTVRILHTPGHTPGHCAFLVEEYDLVFAADIDLTSFGPWYGNPTSDLEQFRQSIRRLRDLQSALLLTSHSAPVTGTEKVNAGLEAYGAVFDRRESALHALLRRQPLTLEQLIDRKLIFKRHPHPEILYRLFERSMVSKHLESLERRGLIERSDDGLFRAL